MNMWSQHTPINRESWGGGGGGGGGGANCYVGTLNADKKKRNFGLSTPLRGSTKWSLKRGEGPHENLAVLHVCVFFELHVTT